MFYCLYVKHFVFFMLNILIVLWHGGKVGCRIEHNSKLISGVEFSRISKRLKQCYKTSWIDGGIKIDTFNVLDYLLLNYEVFRMNIEGEALVFKLERSFSRKQYKLQIPQEYSSDKIRRIITRDNCEREVPVDASKWQCRVIPPTQNNPLFTYILTVNHVSRYNIEFMKRILFIENVPVTLETA